MYRNNAEEGQYKIKVITWVLIAVTWIAPKLFFITYLVINEYSLRRPYEIMKHSSKDLQHEWYSPGMKCCGCIRNPVAIILIYATLVIAIAIIYTGQT